MRFVRMFYKSATCVLQNLGFERVQISFYWQGHRKMMSLLVGSERMSSYVDPRIARNQETVVETGILHQKLIKIWPRDTMICEKVLGMWTPTPPGVELWRTKIRFYPAGHKKKSATTKVSICRFTTFLCKHEDFEKTMILAGPFDKSEPGRNQLDQQ